jgi:hypothetical protein
MLVAPKRCPLLIGLAAPILQEEFLTCFFRFSALNVELEPRLQTTALRIFWLACLFLSGPSITYGDVIAQWNFNSVPPDGSPTTGMTAPSVGTGTASLIGGVTGGFSMGSTNDPASSTDDSGWQTTDYPAKETGNKTAGVQFNVSTVGYSNIVVRWDHRVTSTASKYYRLQYSTNGNTFSDYTAPVIMQAAASPQTYYEAQTNSLANIAAVNNNPNFAFRIISEFEQSAIGSGTNDYVTVSNSTYSPSANVRFDYVTIFGTLIPGGNTPPYISSISNQTIRVTQSTGPLSFTVLDAEDPATNLTVHATSSNPSVISPANVVLNGAGSSRSVTVTAGAQAGLSAITIWVTDTGAKSNSTTFSLTVLPSNLAPVISVIPPTNTLIDVGTPPIPFTIGDPETPAAVLTVSGASANGTLLPNANIVFGGSDSNRTVTLTPAPGQIGVAPITLTVSDGTNTANSLFALMVTPSPSLIFLDSFSYASGSLLTNSGFLWANRSGTTGQCQVTNGQLQITSEQSEDVIGSLIGAPYSTGYGTVLYAAFKARFLTLPNSNPDYFAHFANGSTLRGRIYPFIPTNATFGTFHLVIGNAVNSAELPIDLTTNVSYTLVSRYDIDTATATLWVNPTNETDAGATATDAQSPATISEYGFRQASGFDSTILIDDLRVGLSFASVTNTLPGTTIPIPLNFQREGNKLILTWADVSFGLQSAPSVTGVFTNVPGVISPYTNFFTGTARFYRLKSN